MARKEDYRNPLLQIRVSPELLERLEKVADMYGVTKGEIARMAIGQYVGQVMGLMDRMSEKAVSSMQQFDMEKMVEIMLPKLIEAEKGVSASETQKD